ncbi:MAG TPA: ABC transporter substrate-binding protein [Terriglobia bacterium]|nr:ABC transporter substrate-binding protein [Terriglobia bacterium]
MWLVTKRLSLGLALILLASAVLLVSDWGRRESSGGVTGVNKKWVVNLLEYVNVEDSEESERGILEGLRQSGLVEGRDYEMTIRNAQGDMTTLNGLVDAALTARADLLVTLSTPTLQATIRKSPQQLPIVFTYLADPISAGAGRSFTEHRPNVTGVATGGADQEVLAMLHECLPHARRIGTIVVPSEVNTVYHRDQLVLEARKMGIEVVSVPANTSSDLPDAALALCSMKIDAVCQVAGNLTATGFTSIARAAREARLPAFAFMSSAAEQGAVAVVARDYYDGGIETAQLAVRVMRGEDLASIPIQPLIKNKIILNLVTARAIGLTVPQSIVRNADRVIDR